MSNLKTADEYQRLAARARAGAWTAPTLEARTKFLQTEFNCELMARSVSNLADLKDALEEREQIGAEFLVDCSAGSSSDA